MIYLKAILVGKWLAPAAAITEGSGPTVVSSENLMNE